MNWQFCHSEKDKENVLKNWLRKYHEFQKTHPYQRKYLFLFIQYDFDLLFLILIGKFPGKDMAMLFVSQRSQTLTMTEFISTKTVDG
jgi:hypothetical protein